MLNVSRLSRIEMMIRPISDHCPDAWIRCSTPVFFNPSPQPWEGDTCHV